MYAASPVRLNDGMAWLPPLTMVKIRYPRSVMSSAASAVLSQLAAYLHRLDIEVERAGLSQGRHRSVAGPAGRAAPPGLTQ